MAAIPALRRPAARQFSSARADLRGAFVSAAAGQPGALRQPAGDAVAQGTHAMNVQIHNVISDIVGVTGLAILDAVLAGEREATAGAAERSPD